ncbi:F-box/LRR-repeat protein At4g14103, partial [Linum perenne]
EWNLDRLSSLPDEILSHILSLLPTKYAAGTAVLSRQWKDLCTLVSNINLDNSLIYLCLNEQLPYQSMTPEERIRCRRYSQLSRLVDNVLLQHVNLNCVRRLRLHFLAKKLDLNLRADLWFYWFEKVVRRDESQAEETDVKIAAKCLEESFYALKNLKVLKLDGVIVVVNTPSVSLDCLKTLQLSRVKTRDFSETLRKLISGCPVMATAHLENCCSLNPITIDKEMLVVSVPSLKSLTIIDTIGELCPIVIEAPSLEHLYLGDCTELQIVDSQLSCLVSARVDIVESCILERCMIQFLTQISNAKQVYLSRQTLVNHQHPSISIFQ